MSHLLHIEPSAVTFPASLGFTSETTLSLCNQSGSNVAYRVTTPEDNVYSVRPNSGLIFSRRKIDIELTQCIDKALSNSFDGRQRFLLDVVDLSLIPIAQGRGIFHGYSTFAQLWKSIPQKSVDKIEIAINGIFGDMGPDSDQTFPQIGKIAVSDRGIGDISSSPLSVLPGDQRAFVVVSKAPVNYPRPKTTPVNQFRQGHPLNFTPSPTTTTAQTAVQSRRKTQAQPHKKNTAAATKRNPKKRAKNSSGSWDEHITTPTKVMFFVQPGKPSHTVLRLRNTAGSRSVFKVLTNNLDQYAVRPNMGILEAYAHVNVDFTQQSAPSLPKDLNNCQDYFKLKVAVIDQEPRGGAAATPNNMKVAADIWKGIPEEAVRTTLIRVEMKRTSVAV